MAVATSARPRKRRRPSLLRQIFAAFQLLVLSGFVLGLVFTAVTIWNLSTILPQGAGSIGDMAAPESTKILSADGHVLATIFMDENREYVPLEKIPKSLRNATVAIEDKRFYDHNGVDFRGIGRALVEDVKTKARAQGGSTITQQLVRNVYLTQRKSVGRKIQEALLAVQIERKYSKDEILEKYLNQVFYGSGSYGVQAAARTYFGKKVWELDLAESALLAGLPQRPTAYSPYKNLQYARNRRNTVLEVMAQEGYITQEQKRKAQDEAIKPPFRRPSGAYVRRAPYFVDYVLEDLVDRYGANTVYKGGLRISTTLHTGMQAVADKSLKDRVKAMARQHVTQGALVAIDPRTGFIRAMVGGVDYQKSQLNRAYLNKHPRSPGSTFKPFVYAAAFENGMDPYDTVVDEPISIDDGSAKPWQPKNWDDDWFGHISVKKAVAFSRNIPAITTMRKIGIDKTIDVARRLGVESPLDKVLSLAIGTSGITMVEMAAAYGAFANDGIVAEPLAILRITDRDGNVIEENKPRVRKVLRDSVQNEVDQCLRAVVTEGTARRVGAAIEGARGKTGTAQGDRDAWFVGYVPKQMVTAVWVGNDDNSPMREVFGGTNCAPIWIDFMRAALKMNPKLKSVPKPLTGEEAEKEAAEEKDRERRTAPRREREKERETRNEDTPRSRDSDSVRVRLCADTGLRATRYCPSAYTERFTRGETPGERCNLHTGDGDSAGQSDRSDSEESSRDESSRNDSDRSESRDSSRSERRESDRSEGRDGDSSSRESRVTEPEPRRVSERRERRRRVSICLTSGERSTGNCPETIQRRLPESEIPSSYCSVH
jgi:penicillin-binding protein 1A